MSLVSTIIPAYNAARFIRDTVESALAQEGAEQEVIVVDDGSTDETPGILAEYGDRIRTVRQTNAGQHSARNHGARLAKGEWVSFLDSDDIWLPTKLKSQLEAVAAGEDFCLTGWENFGESERVPALAPAPPAGLFERPFETLLQDNPLTTSTVMIRSAVFRRLNGFDESLLPGCEDWDLWLRYAQDGGRFAFVPQPLVRYRWHASSTSRRVAHMLAARLEVVRKALTSERGRQLPNAEVRRALASVWSTSAWFAQPINRWQAFRWYARSLCYSPFDFGTYKNMLKCMIGRA